MKGGTSIIAFAEDLTGYKWELIQRPQPCLNHIMLRVKDLDASLRYYTESLGMKEIKRSDNEGEGF